MRLLIIPFIFVAILVQVPISAQDNTNQESAEKIADAISENFPDAGVDVAYQGGKVWLKGEAVTQDQRKEIVEHVFHTTDVRVNEVSDEIQVVAPKVAVAKPVEPAVKPVMSAATAPVPMPRAGVASPLTANQVPPAQVAPTPAVPPQVQPPQLRQRRFAGTAVMPYPYAQNQNQAAYGLTPAQQAAIAPQQSAPANPYAPQQYAPMQYDIQQQAIQQYIGQRYAMRQSAVPQDVPQNVMPQQVAVPQAVPQQIVPQYAHHYRQPAYYGPPAGAAHHPEAYGQQGPLPGRYNQPNLPQHAWPAYANYPNYAQVSYPRMYSPKAWPYIGPFYPYPQTPLGWRKVTLENHNGWWWLDFDDGTPSGAFSGLFRQPTQYTY